MSEKSEAEVLADALTAQPVCICHAACYIECACDAIWPEQWVDSAAAKLRRLSAENETLKAERDALLGLIKEARKIVRASSSRNFVKDWDQRTTAAIKSVEEGK